MENQNIKPCIYTFCHSSYLYNNIQTSKDKTLIFDMRDSQNFHKHHIKGSINLTNQRIQDYLESHPEKTNVSSLNAIDFSEILDANEFKKFSKRRRCYCFFIVSEENFPRDFIHEIKGQYDENDDEFFQTSEEKLQNSLQRTLGSFEETHSIVNTFDVFKILQKDKVKEMFIVSEGASNFFLRYPYMANHLQSDAIATIVHKNLFASYEGSLPHDILDSRLFLGSFKHSEKYDIISELKITHILNITAECENVHEDKGIKYLKISILDESDKEIHNHFKQAYEFIHEALSDDNSNHILIHCAMGKSRSATITIMFLMKRFSWNFEKAFNFVKRKREIVCPNEGFVQRLQEFEQNDLAF